MNQPSNRIREIRLEKKISGTKIAKELGISPQYYYDLEKGDRNLSAELALNIAKILEVSLEYLLGGEAEQFDAYHKKEEIELKNKILVNMIDLVDDEGHFYEDVREDVFNAIISFIHMAPAFHNSYDHESYAEDFANYFDYEFEYMDDQKKALVSSFNAAYNYRTVKSVLDSNYIDNNYSFLEELKVIKTKHGIKEKETPTKEFVSKLELSDTKLLNEFELELDGQKLSENETKEIISYLRTRRLLEK